MAKAQAKMNLLQALAAGDPRGVIALMLWKNRLREPDMYVQITEDDIKGFQDCTAYLKVIPEVRIHQPGEIPAQPAIAATANRRAVPARAAIPPRPYVMVTLVEKGTENAIRPVENNEADYDAAQAASKVRQAKSDAPQMASRLINMATKGEFSLSEIQDAADALIILSRAA